MVLVVVVVVDVVEVVAVPAPDSSSACFERFECLENKGILYGVHKVGGASWRQLLPRVRWLSLSVCLHSCWPAGSEHGGSGRALGAMPGRTRGRRRRRRECDGLDMDSSGRESEQLA